MLLEDFALAGLSDSCRANFRHWEAFLEQNLDRDAGFFAHDSKIHGKLHTVRVLLYALILAEQILPDNDEAREILAHAAIFHDTRRRDDLLDTGHGGRGAAHYRQYATKNSLPFHPEAVFLMRFHDRDDALGQKLARKPGSPILLPTLLAIFKDADGLDRWRLGEKALDLKYLRTDAARKLTAFSKKVVGEPVIDIFAK